MIDFEIVKSLLGRLGYSLPLFALALGILWFGKALYQWTEKFSFADQLTEQDNPAFGTALTGYLIGMTLALAGVIPREPIEGWAGLGSAATLLLGQGVLIAVLMRVSVLVLRFTTLRYLRVREELVRDRNIGVGAVIAGGCLASGLVLRGALSGTSVTPLYALRDVLIYWLAGQLIFLAGSTLFTALVRFDLEQALERDNNAAAGLSLGGFLVAVGIVVHASLIGAGSDVVGELVIILISAAVGLVLLAGAALLTGRLFLPHSPVAKEIAVDKNPAAGLISAALFIAVALLLARAIAG